MTQVCYACKLALVDRFDEVFLMHIPQGKGGGGEAALVLCVCPYILLPMCLSAYTSVYASVCIHISQFITNRKYCPAYEEACVRARVRDISLTHTHTHTSHSDLKVEIDKPENQAAAVATAGSYMTGSVQAKPL